jgi:hypothetical protein
MGIAAYPRTQSPTDTPELRPPEPIITPTTSVPVSFDQGWSRLELSGEGSLHDIEFIGDRWVAVGTTGRDVLAWWSPDGVTWMPGRHHPPGRLEAVARAAGGVIGVGAVATSNGERAAVWRGDLDLRWEQVALLEATDLGGVLEHEGTLVAWGPQGIWTAEAPEKDWIASPGVGAINQVVAAGGELVAVGSDGSGPAVWRSADGYRWSRQPLQGGPEGPVWSLRSMVPFDGGYLGLFTFTPASSTAQLWRSDDLQRWNQVPRVLYSFDRLLAAGPGLVAIADGSPSGDLWFSDDGSRWQPVPHPQMGSMDVIADAATVATTVVVGADLGQPMLWTWGEARPVEFEFEHGAWQRVARLRATHPAVPATRPRITGSLRAQPDGVIELAIRPVDPSGLITEGRIESWPWQGSVWAATEVEGVVVAIGSDKQGRWLVGREDGRAWTVQAAELPEEPAAGYPPPISPLPGGLVLRTAEGKAWFTDDGLSWVRLPGEGAATVGATWVAYNSQVILFPDGEELTSPATPVLDALELGDVVFVLTPGRLWSTADRITWRVEPLTVFTGFGGAYPTLIDWNGTLGIVARDHAEWGVWQDRR